MLRLATLVLCLAAAGCDSAGVGAYDVTLFDLQGDEAARIELVFERPTPGEATEGTYRVFSGALTGTTSGTLHAIAVPTGDIVVQIDPLVADGGAELTGAFGAEPFEGTWTVGSFAGPQPGGTFRAARR